MNDKNNWEELIDRHLRGELHEAEKEHLAELLDSDAAARREHAAAEARRDNGLMDEVAGVQWARSQATSDRNEPAA